MRRREISGGARAYGLLERVRRLGRSGQAAPLAGSGRPSRQERDLDWRDLQERLDPVLRHRWDLAILVNLDEQEGRRPTQLLAVINAQAGEGWQLSPQVLSVRLRALEQDGYLRHEDVSRLPVTRVYRLLQPGRGLIEDLRSAGFLLTRSRTGSCAADTALPHAIRNGCRMIGGLPVHPCLPGPGSTRRVSCPCRVLARDAG